MEAATRVDNRAEWSGGFNMSMLSLQVAPEAWWSAFLWALEKDGMLEAVHASFVRRHAAGFMTEE
jgi:hypothetical protein